MTTKTKQTDNETLVKALRILARDIQSEDGIANACIAEAADRIEYQDATYNDMEYRFGCVLEKATGGMMSKTNYDKDTMYAEIDNFLARERQEAYDDGACDKLEHQTAALKDALEALKFYAHHASMNKLEMIDVEQGRRAKEAITKIEAILNEGR